MFYVLRSHSRDIDDLGLTVEYECHPHISTTRGVLLLDHVSV